MHFFENPNFDFMGKARLCIVGSLVIIGLSIAVFALRGEKNFGIDFKGGDLTVLTTRSSGSTPARCATRWCPSTSRKPPSRARRKTASNSSRSAAPRARARPSRSASRRRSRRRA